MSLSCKDYAAVPGAPLGVPHWSCRRAYELDTSGVYAPHGVTVLTLQDDLIDEITHFRTPALLEHFGLPARA